MSNADQDHAAGGSTIPTRVIHEAFVNSKHARQGYIQARKSDQGLEPARRQLQQAVLAYYEVLREYIKEHLEDYWHGKLPTNGNEGIAIFGYADTTADVPLSDFEPNGSLKDDAPINRDLGHHQQIQGLADINHDAGIATLRIRNYRAGLKQLEDTFNQTTVKHTQKKGSPLGNRVVTKEKSQQLDAGLLFTAARCLDEATKELGLLAEVEEGTPRTQITEETLEEVKAWREQNIE